MKPVTRKLHNKNNNPFIGIIMFLIMLFSFSFVLFNNEQVNAQIIGPGGQGTAHVYTYIRESSTSSGVKFDGNKIMRKDEPCNWAYFNAYGTYSGSFRPMGPDGNPMEPYMSSSSFTYNGVQHTISCDESPSDVTFKFNFGISNDIYVGSCYNGEIYIEVPGNYGDTLYVTATFSMGANDTSSTSTYTFAEYIEDNDPPSISTFRINNGFDPTDSSTTYIEGNSLKLYLYWKEPNYSYHNVYIDDNYVSCSGSLTSSTSYHGETLTCDISNISTSYSTSHTVEIYIVDNYGHSTTKNDYFHKIDGSRHMNIMDFHFRADGAHEDNLISKVSGGNLTVYYAVDEESYLDPGYMYLQIGDSTYEDSETNFTTSYGDPSCVVDNGENINIETYYDCNESGLSPSEWLDYIGESSSLTASITLVSIYGEYVTEEISMTTDYTSPYINSKTFTNNMGVDNG